MSETPTHLSDDEFDVLRHITDRAWDDGADHIPHAIDVGDVTSASIYFGDEIDASYHVKVSIRFIDASLAKKHDDVPPVSCDRRGDDLDALATWLDETTTRLIEAWASHLSNAHD